MTFQRRRLLGWTILLLLAAIGTAHLLRLDLKRKISTDVLDLVPVDERNPELALVRELASQAEARTMLFVLTGAGGRAAPLDAARRFAAELTRTGRFAEAIALGDPTWRDAIGRELFEVRFPLLFPSWLHAHDQRDLPRAVALELKTFLEKPEALAFQDLIPADPLLLLPDAISRLKGGLALLQPDAGTSDHALDGLVWARLTDSPLSEAGQQPAFDAIERATAAVRGEFAGLNVEFTGVNRFAAASRARIEREVSWLNTLSIIAVFGVAAIFIRHLRRALHLVPTIAFSVLSAWVVTTLVFERVHVIVFVLGALLAGVAIDYGFYLFMQPPAFSNEDYWAKVRRLAKPLLASCLTTVIGFALLLFSKLPMIRQLGVFVGAGLLGALAIAVIYFSTVRDPFLEPRTYGASGRLSSSLRRRLRQALIAVWIIALPGLARLGWRDDIRQLEVPDAEVQANDARVRAAFGQGSDRTVFLTHGTTLEEARAAVDVLERWLGDRVPHANLAAVIPTAAARAAAKDFVREHPDFPEQLRRALEREGFSAEEFGPFFTAYAEYARHGGGVDDAVQRLQSKLTGPLGSLLHLGPGRNWFVTLATGATADSPPASANTVTASQLQSLNRLFGEYRASALHLSVVGLAMVGVGVLLTYGVRDGVRIFAIPCGACLGIFGVFGWLGAPLNLFHLLGAFLGVCLTHNYSIFSATSAYRHERPPVSVRLSALTAGASFGVLALSGIPVVRALGVTVSAMVIAALLVIELEHLSPLAKPA